MDMTKDIIDYEQKLDEECAEASDYTTKTVTQTATTTATTITKTEITDDAEDEVEAITEKEHSEMEEEEARPTEMAIEEEVTTATDELTATTKTITASRIAQTPTPPTRVAAEATTLLGDEDDEDNVGHKYKTHAGELTPPPRPLTSSEVVGLSEPIDPELRVELEAKKSRSLPVSPQPTSIMTQHLNAAALYEFPTVEERRPRKELNKQQQQSSTSMMPTTSGRKSKTPTHVATASKASASQQFCLRWNNYQSNLTNVFDELLQNESFVDVTLACEGHSIKAHKMVLSACSPYFQALFYDNPCQHPIIIMRDVNWCDLKAIVEFMYKGEINVCQEQINPLLKVAETLKIRGLAEVSAGAHGPGGGVAAHPMLPEQRMTVYNDDVDEDEVRATLEMRDRQDNLYDDDELIGCQKPKRARLLAKLQTDRSGSTIDLNLSSVRHQRKRSRDGHMLEPTRRSRTPSPVAELHRRSSESPLCRNTPTPAATGAAAVVRDEPIAMTTSTIVRNPFASPNPQAALSVTATVGNAASVGSSTGSSATSSSSSSTSSSSSSASSANTAAAGAAYHQHQQHQQQQHHHHHRPTTARSCSPPTAHSNDSASLASPTTAAQQQHQQQQQQQQQSQLPPHVAAAAVVAAAAHQHGASPGAGAASSTASSMHHHAAAAAAAQQLAAQHQLHAAAAHSHVAMASALGASLAAAAAGGSASGAGGAGVPGGGSSSGSGAGHHEEMEIKPEIAEMIREEERAKMIESGGHPWIGGGASTSSVADSYQYQLQSMWQKCWNTNQQNLVQQLRFRERGPLKSWRPEAMAEAIFSVLKEGLSLSQAARKYDIPYPTFVLYANRVHNMLGPSLDGGADPRPKARGRPQRILLGMWPEELIRSVIKAVVFRDYREIKEEIAGGHPYANGQGHVSPFGASAGNSVAAAAANGYHSAAKLNAALAPPTDANSPLSSMTETLRRQILSQQQQSPLSQSMNMYKSPAYLQRSEIEDQVSAAAVAAAKHQHSERRGSENLPDLSALGLMGIPGLNVMPTQSQRGASQMHPSAASYAREREREREMSREMSRERERERELKEAMQARQYGNQSRGSSSSGGGVSGPKSGVGAAGSSSGVGAASPFSHYNKHKEPHSYAYNKRFLESLPPGIDFEAIANGLLQKSVNKSPRFEDFFPGQDMSELFANAESAAAAGGTGAGGYPPTSVRESPLMKIKLEQQQTAEVPHED